MVVSFGLPNVIPLILFTFFSNIDHASYNKPDTQSLLISIVASFPPPKVIPLVIFIPF
jgi:hypothetical protein